MRIGIGSAQFGLDYGISNSTGKIPAEGVEHILSIAIESGIDLIDTSPYYGDAETVIGSLPSSREFNIVSKTAAIDAPSITADTAMIVRKRLIQSLKALKREHIYGLIIHRTSDIRKKGASHLFDALQSIKNDGLVEKIGISIYTEEEADIALGMADLDIIQAPVSLFNQSLIRSGALDTFQSKGIEIHARSIFMQGALFLDPLALPRPLLSLQHHLEKLRALASAEGVSLHCLALNFVRSIECIKYCIVGIDSPDHLSELNNCKVMTLPDMTEFHLESEMLRDPSMWKL